MSEPVDPLQAAVDDIIANEDIWQTDDNPPIDELEQMREHNWKQKQQNVDVAPTGVKKKKKQKQKQKPEPVLENQPEPEMQPTGIPEGLKPWIKQVFGESSTQKQCECPCLGRLVW